MRATSSGAGPRSFFFLVASSLVTLSVLFAPPARAAIGYEPDPSAPVIDLEGEKPQGVAIDQGTQRIYVAMPIRSFLDQEFGQVEQLDSSGVPTAASPFSAGPQTVFSGVAVNPLTHGIYAAEFRGTTPVGTFGTPRIDQFSADGALGTQFATSNTISPKIAADSNGRLFFPNEVDDSVQVFDSAGALQETITCTGCPGGGFKEPNGVALDSANNLYVVDLEGGRVMKFTHSGGPYAFASTLQSGKAAVAVAVDISDNSVFVGDEAGKGGYHVVAYDSSGQQFDDFGAGLVGGTTVGNEAASQIAVNATTHKLYISDPEADVLRVFAQAPIEPPTVNTNPATSVGQVTATMNASVNANLHATTDCHFDYIDHADFLVNGFEGAAHLPCSSLPSGSKSTAVSATPTNLLPNTTYNFQAVATNNGGTEEGINRTFTTLASTPATVTTGTDSEVTQTSTTLTGKVNPHGGSVSDCRFEYGVASSYDKSVPCPTAIGPVTTDVTETVKVSGLSAKTTYQYRLSVTTNAGLVQGNVEELTTLPLAPAVGAGVASAVSQSSATIAGGVNPNGGPTSCHFEYGTTIAYGASTACAPDPGASEATVAVHADLASLIAGTTYHYRLVATNAGGTTNGPDVSFGTLPVPPLVTPTPPTPKALKCKKGFQKKKVRGKLKCVKKKRKKRRHH